MDRVGAASSGGRGIREKAQCHALLAFNFRSAGEENFTPGRFDEKQGD